MDRAILKELRTAARVADALVYAAGVAGVVAGALLFQGGQPGFAVVAWALTFIAGAGLRLASASARALAELLARTERLESEVAALRMDAPALPPSKGQDMPDPYRRWGGHH